MISKLTKRNIRDYEWEAEHNGRDANIDSVTMLAVLKLCDLVEVQNHSLGRVRDFLEGLGHDRVRVIVHEAGIRAAEIRRKRLAQKRKGRKDKSRG